MIDEKKLEKELEKIHELSQYESKFIKWIRSEKEIRRLALLGRWAEKHGIPVLEAFKTTDYEKKWCTKDESSLISSRWFHGVCSGERAEEALAALPQEMKNPEYEEWSQKYMDIISKNPTMIGKKEEKK